MYFLWLVSDFLDVGDEGVGYDMILAHEELDHLKSYAYKYARQFSTENHHPYYRKLFIIDEDISADPKRLDYDVDELFGLECSRGVGDEEPLSH